MSRNILVISAHPDDETFGCGGTLLAHAASGDKIYWLIVTKGDPSQFDSAVLAAEEKEVAAVAKALQVREYFWPGLRSTMLDSLPSNDIISVVRDAVDVARPQIVYTVHHGDIHTDHRAVFDAVSIVLKTFHMRRLGVQSLLSFECLSSTDAAPQFYSRAFLPNVYRDISPFMDEKIRVMKLYQTQLQGEKFPRSESGVRALGRYRGSTIGVEYAECFMLVREVLS